MAHGLVCENCAPHRASATLVRPSSLMAQSLVLLLLLQQRRWQRCQCSDCCFPRRHRQLLHVLPLVHLQPQPPPPPPLMLLLLLLALPPPRQ